MNTISDNQYIIHAASFGKVDSKWSKTIFPYPNHRIYYVTDGEANLYLVDQYIKLQKGHMYLLPAFLMVETVCKKSLSHYYIHFQQNLFAQRNIFDLYNHRVDIELTDDSSIQPLFETIINHHKINTIESKLLAQGSLQILLSRFFRGADIKNPEYERFLSTTQYIISHLSEDISINDLAHMMNLNPVYFSNAFSSAIGLSPKKYIISKRMELAQLLLANSSYTVKEIACKTGFNDDKYFSKVFRAKINMTPIEYRCHVTDNQSK